jgi:RNA polymerase sigma-70 factor (ECF subfamily)
MPAEARPVSIDESPSTVDPVPQRDVEWAETLRRIRAFVTSRTGDPELAADITQDVVVRSISSGALDRVDDVTAWLYRSARNAVIDHYRTRRPHRDLPDLDLWPDPETSTDLPNEATRELASCLQPLLDRLPPESRDALTRVDLEGQTHQQAADQLDISVSGMKSRVQRARRRLRDQVTGCCPVELDHAGAVIGYQAPGDGCSCGS